MTALRDIQAAFIHDIYAGERTSAVYLDKRNGSVERLSIYSNNTLFGLTDILANAYPVVKKIVGEDFFKTIARHYLMTHPQPAGNRHMFGNHLDVFLKGFAPAAPLIYLPEVAALEWAHFQSAIADDAEAMDFNSLAAGMSSAPDFVLSPHPSVHVLSQTMNALDIWRAHQKEDVAGLTLVLRAETLMIWRAPDDAVLIRPISSALVELVTQSRQGAPFGEALGAAGAQAPDMQKFQQEFAEALNLGVFSKI